MKKITKAVFPVAGLGTPLPPATKASPKEMLPVVDKPLIQYAVEEAAAAGITDMIFITGRNKRAIEDHFDKAYELETELALRNKTRAARAGAGGDAARHQLHLHPAVRGAGARPRGAVRRAGRRRRAVRRAARRRPDRRDGAGDAADGRRLRSARMRRVIGVMDVPRATTSAATASSRPREPAGERIGAITRIVEKPKPGTAPSTLAVVGRYVLTPRIFHHLRTMPPGAGGEIQLTDGIARLLDEERVRRVSRSKAAATTAGASSATSRRRSTSASSIRSRRRRFAASSCATAGARRRR